MIYAANEAMMRAFVGSVSRVQVVHRDLERCALVLLRAAKRANCSRHNGELTIQTDGSFDLSRREFSDSTPKYNRITSDSGTKERGGLTSEIARNGKGIRRSIKINLIMQKKLTLTGLQSASFDQRSFTIRGQFLRRSTRTVVTTGFRSRQGARFRNRENEAGRQRYTSALHFSKMQFSSTIDRVLAIAMTAVVSTVSC